MLGCGLCSLLAGAGIALAQIPGGLPSTVAPGRDRPPLMAPTQPNFDFRIEAPNRSAVPRAVDELRFHLEDIRVQGAVTLPPESFRPLYQQLLGKDVSLSDILDVAGAIEAEYRRNGYILVRAFVPPQRVADGIFTINVVEGFIANVAVEGGDEGTRQRIRAYVQPALDAKPLPILTIEQGLLLANDLPGITAGGLLRPSLDTPGASDLTISVTQNPLTAGLEIDNRGSAFSGLWSATADVAVTSIFDDGDELAGTVTTSFDLAPFRRVAGQLRYVHPVGERGGMLSLIGTLTHGEPGSTLTAFDVLTKSWAIGPRLSYPIKRTRAESISFEGGLTIQSARVSVLGAHFSRDNWRVADLGVTYLRNTFLGGALTANLDIAQGLPILESSRSESPELSRVGGRIDFTKLTGAFRLVHPIQNGFSFMLGAQGQFAFDRLITGEQFAFGGLQFGRGYDPGAISGDRGLGTAFELRYDKQYGMSSVQALEPYLFLDTARVWNVRTPSLGDQSLTSTGGGVRFWLAYNVTGDLEIAQTLDPVRGSDSGKRATKLLLNVAVRY
jgi:hemolysin activation/secretion protein